jgi:ubiquinone/menaquinone biosynthesis C-methylase UbiE
MNNSDQNQTYHPEPYWSKVAQRINARQGTNVIAGDDEPYYRYKRDRFLEMLATLPFDGQSVLEIGHGPGGNLLHIDHHFRPSQLQGVDISADMVRLATSRLPEHVKVQKVNGTELPFADQSIDLVFSATVLQHNTDEKMLTALIAEMCRVARKQVYIFERIDDPIAGDELCLGRPTHYYEALFNQHGFQLRDVEFINIHTSYLVAGVTRKVLNPGSRQEGEPLNGVSLLIQDALLPLTKRLDKAFTVERDLAKLAFTRDDLHPRPAAH